MARKTKAQQYQERQDKIKPMLAVAEKQWSLERNAKAELIKANQKPYFEVIDKKIVGEVTGKLHERTLYRNDETIEPLTKQALESIKKVKEMINGLLNPEKTPKERHGLELTELEGIALDFTSSMNYTFGLKREMKYLLELSDKITSLQQTKDKLVEGIYEHAWSIMDENKYEYQPTAGDFNDQGEPNERVKGLLKRAGYKENESQL